MRPIHGLALLLATGLALGCASAQAQEEGAPEPQRRPPAPDDEIGRRIRETEARSREAQRRLEELRATNLGVNHPSVQAAQRSIDEARRDLEVMLHERDETRGLAGRAPNDGADPDLVRRIRDAEQRLSDLNTRMDTLRSQKVSDKKPEFQELLRSMYRSLSDLARLRAERDELRAAAERANPPQRGPRTGLSFGPGADVEQRLEQLERAVREMHAMFERHGIAPEMRERAEREMRERRDGPSPAGSRPEEPSSDRRIDSDQERPRPPRTQSAEMEELTRRHAEMAAAYARVRDEESRQLRQQLETARRQIEESRAALERAKAELEEFRAKK